MGKPEVKSLVAFISSRSQVVNPLILSHRPPLLLTVGVTLNVVYLSEGIQHHIGDTDGEQDSITPLVSRSIILSVDIGGDDAGGLHEHIVQRSRDRSGADCVGIARVPSDLDWMGAGVAEEQRHDAECCPFVDFRDIDHVDVYEEWEGPYLADGGGECQLSPDLGNVSQGHHSEHMGNS